MKKKKKKLSGSAAKTLKNIVSIHKKKKKTKICHLPIEARRARVERAAQRLVPSQPLVTMILVRPSGT